MLYFLKECIRIALMSAIGGVIITVACYVIVFVAGLVVSIGSGK